MHALTIIVGDITEDGKTLPCQLVPSGDLPTHLQLVAVRTIETQLIDRLIQEAEQCGYEAAQNEEDNSGDAIRE